MYSNLMLARSVYSTSGSSFKQNQIFEAFIAAHKMIYKSHMEGSYVVMVID